MISVFWAEAVFPQDYQWVLCPFLFVFSSEIYSKQWEMPEGNFSILSKIKICARIHAYIHVDTCVIETHFLCYLWSIYLNHSKIQLMHNTEKSPVELGRKHETLFCDKFCTTYYLLFPSSTSSMEPYLCQALVQTPRNLKRLWPEQSLRGQYLFINHIPGQFHFPPSTEFTLMSHLAI